MGEPKYSSGIECPICNSQKSGVTDKRNYTDRIWRRRKCDKGHVYSTNEIVETDENMKNRITKNYFNDNNPGMRKFENTYKELTILIHNL